MAEPRLLLRATFAVLHPSREFTVATRCLALLGPIAMGASTSRAKPEPERPPVPAGKVRVCVAGFAVSHNVGRAASVARAIVANSPDQFESWFYFDDQGARQTIKLALCSALCAPTPDPHAGFRGERSRFLGPRGTGGFLAQLKSELEPAQRTTFADHATAPFCWLERPGGVLEALGGRDELSAWAMAEFPGVAAISTLASGKPAASEAFFDKSPGTAQ